VGNGRASVHTEATGDGFLGAGFADLLVVDEKPAAAASADRNEHCFTAFFRHGDVSFDRVGSVLGDGGGRFGEAPAPESLRTADLTMDWSHHQGNGLLEFNAYFLDFARELEW
jgi:hypothetical protein